MDVLVDETRKKVKVPPKKTSMKTVFGRVEKQILLKKVHYFDRDDMEFDEMGQAAEGWEYEKVYNDNG
nr:hypothetical protein [Tanacetum cinerariifolium]